MYCSKWLRNKPISKIFDFSKVTFPLFSPLVPHPSLSLGVWTDQLIFHLCLYVFLPSLYPLFHVTFYLPFSLEDSFTIISHLNHVPGWYNVLTCPEIMHFLPSLPWGWVDKFLDVRGSVYRGNSNISWGCCIGDYHQGRGSHILFYVVTWKSTSWNKSI
jgi:hypothetical protein